MGGKSKATQTTSNAPYPAAGKLLDRGMGDALSQYNNGGLVKPNTMSTVVPYASQTKQAMSGLQGIAQANSGWEGLGGKLQGIINNDGYNLDQMRGIGGIRQTATADFDINSDPGFQQVFDKTRDAVNQNAAGMGRYASGTHDGVMTRELGDLGARQYQNFQTRKDAAQAALFNAGQTAQGNMTNAYQGMQDTFNPLLQVGAMNEDLAGRELNDRLRIASEQDNSKLANIQALLGIASGGNGFSTATQTAQGPNSTMSNLMGGALGGASLLSNGGRGKL